MYQDKKKTVAATTILSPESILRKKDPITILPFLNDGIKLTILGEIYSFILSDEWGRGE